MCCPHCQHEHREGARFCAACGSAIASKCPSCGSQPPPGATFCDRCGTSLIRMNTAATPPLFAARPLMAQASTPPYLAEKILTTRSVLEGERKQVAVLFADLEGSMKLLANRAPEEADLLLDLMLECPLATASLCQGIVT
jgi:hypothetical protein